MNDYETILLGFSASEPTRYSVQIETAKDKKFIRFDAGEDMKKAFTNPLKVTYKHTVGDMNRKHLHDKLDQWINTNLADKESIK